MSRLPIGCAVNVARRQAFQGERPIIVTKSLASSRPKELIRQEMAATVICGIGRRQPVPRVMRRMRLQQGAGEGEHAIATCRLCCVSLVMVRRHEARNDTDERHERDRIRGIDEKSKRAHHIVSFPGRRAAAIA